MERISVTDEERAEAKRRAEWFMAYGSIEAKVERLFEAFTHTIQRIKERDALEKELELVSAECVGLRTALEDKDAAATFVAEGMYSELKRLREQNQMLAACKIEDGIQVVRTLRERVKSLEEELTLLRPAKTVETAPGGTLVQYTATNGFPSQRECANKVLSPGGIYTVDSTVQHRWRTDVYLRGYPGQAFNSVMFELVKTL